MNIDDFLDKESKKISSADGTINIKNTSNSQSSGEQSSVSQASLAKASTNQPSTGSADSNSETGKKLIHESDLNQLVADKISLLQNVLLTRKIPDSLKAYNELLQFSKKIPQSPERIILVQALIDIHKKIQKLIADLQNEFARTEENVLEELDKGKKLLDANDTQGAAKSYVRSIEQYKLLSDDFYDRKEKLHAQLVKFQLSITLVHEKLTTIAFNTLAKEIGLVLQKMDAELEACSFSNALALYDQADSIFKKLPQGFVGQKTILLDALMKRKNTIDLALQIEHLQSELQKSSTISLPSASKVLSRPKPVEKESSLAISPSSSSFSSSPFIAQKSKQSEQSLSEEAESYSDDLYSSNQVSVVSEDDLQASIDALDQNVSGVNMAVARDLDDSNVSSSNLSSSDVSSSDSLSSDLYEANTLSKKATDFGLDELEVGAINAANTANAANTTNAFDTVTVSANSLTPVDHVVELPPHPHATLIDDALRRVKIGKAKIAVLDNKKHEAVQICTELLAEFPNDLEVMELAKHLQIIGHIKRTHIHHRNVGLAGHMDHIRAFSNPRRSLERKVLVARRLIKKGNAAKANNYLEVVLRNEPHNGAAKRLKKKISKMKMRTT